MINKILIGILIVIMIVGGSYFHFNNKVYEEEIIELRQELAESDTMRVLVADSSTIERMAVKYSELESENEVLQNRINELGLELRSQVQLTATWKAQYDSISTELDSVYNEETESYDRFVRFNASNPPHRFLSGYYYVIPVNGGIFIERDELIADINVELAESKVGIWHAFASTNTPGLRLSAIEVKVNPYELTWRDNLYLIGRGSILSYNLLEGPLGYSIEGGLGFFEHHSIVYGINEHNNYIQYEFTYRLGIF